MSAVVRKTDFVVVEGDHEKYIPQEYVGHPVAPNYYCRAWNGKPSRMHYCKRRAGHGTDHLGQGRCKWHGGATVIKHGLRSRYFVRSEKMAERIKRMEEDPTLLDMRNELTILCALLDDALGRDKLDKAAVERLSVEASRMKERIRNTSAKNAFSVEQMKKFWFTLNRTIEFVLSDHPELCDKLQKQISQIGI